MFSRGVAVLRGKTLIVNLPGSPKAVQESLDAILDELPHGLDMLRNSVQNCARDERLYGQGQERVNPRFA